MGGGPALENGSGSVGEPMVRIPIPPGDSLLRTWFRGHRKPMRSPAHLPLTTNPGNKKNVSTARFIRSIKNAPTIGTTTKACGAGPWRRVSACMLAIRGRRGPHRKTAEGSGNYRTLVITPDG